jgi:sulfur-carrier protein
VIRVLLPTHLKTLAGVSGEVQIEVGPPATLGATLTALEARFPVLQGAIRDHGTLKRRAFVRYYACEEDFSLAGPETVLPEAVAKGVEPLMIVGAVAGG